MNYSKFIILLLFLSPTTQADILYRSNLVSKEDYNAYIESHTEYQSYTEAYLKYETKLMPDFLDSVASAKNFELEKNSSAAYAEYEKSLSLILSRPLNSETQKTYLQIMLRLLDLSANAETANHWRFEIHKLLKLVPLLSQTLPKALIESLKKQWEKSPYFIWRPRKEDKDFEYLLVNGEKFKINAWTEIKLYAGAYQFVLLSNAFRPIMRFTSAMSFQEETEAKVAFAEGHCLNPKMNTSTTAWGEESKVFYNEKCLISPMTSSWQETAKTDFQELPTLSSTQLNQKSHWLWPTLIAVGVGALAYTLKDKKVVVTLPRF